jgi:CheY-like chemotaxis protein
MANQHILVVEDDRDILDTMVEILEGEGYGVSAARNGQEALAALRAGGSRPALILLDLMMPIMNGIEFREEQLKDAQLARIPIVLISADSDLKGNAAKLTAAAFMGKPIKLQPLLDTIEDILQGRA